ncbi:GIY-YIG nuclease family protein [Kocuria sp. WN036]|uniref:GIY-YIG nuclease family protein n=1 Tax=Kocuria sp. WN036 TaxID=2032628 RepID=UPI001595C998|nr:GIY-YIG nuclease family protein [Kocuria sp. WN036]
MTDGQPRRSANDFGFRIPGITSQEVSGEEPETQLAGPIRPNETVREELQRLLEADESRLGAVFRGQSRGLTAEQIAAELGVDTSNFVWNQTRYAQALVNGELPSAPTIALAAARKFRTILKSVQLSEEAKRVLEVNLAELERRASDETARVVEDKKAQEQTEEAESQNEIGVYVYALPHYLRYPFDDKSGRTLMKVGRSDSDVIIRFRNQTRTTALPEEPILLRIYGTDSGDAASMESTFHRLLEAADHHRSVARTAGREWFVTSTRFLDEVARALELKVRMVNEVDVDGGD